MEIKMTNQERVFIYHQSEQQKGGMMGTPIYIARTVKIVFKKEMTMRRWVFDKADIQFFNELGQEITSGGRKWARDDWKFMSEIHHLIEKHLSGLLSEKDED